MLSLYVDVFFFQQRLSQAYVMQASRDKTYSEVSRRKKQEGINGLGTVNAKGKIIYPRTQKTGQRLNRVPPLDLIGLSKLEYSC